MIDKQTQKGFMHLILAGLIAALAVAAIGGFILYRQNQTSAPESVLQRAKYIDDYDAKQLAASKSPTKLKQVYADLHHEGYLTDALLTKLNGSAADWDGLQCLSPGTKATQSYGTANVQDNATATLVKTQTYPNELVGSGDAKQTITLDWVQQNGTWKLDTVQCPK